MLSALPISGWVWPSLMEQCCFDPSSNCCRGDTDMSPWSHERAEDSPLFLWQAPTFLSLSSPGCSQSRPLVSRRAAEICIELFAKLTLRSIKHSNLKWVLVPLWNSRHISAVSACIIWWHGSILRWKWRGRIYLSCSMASNSIKSFGLKQTHIFEFYIFHNGSVHPQKIVFINFYGLNVPRILWPWRRMKSEKWQNKKTLPEHYWFVVTALMGNYYFQ